MPASKGSTPILRPSNEKACDEQQPACSRCVARGYSCIYVSSIRFLCVGGRLPLDSNRAASEIIRDAFSSSILHNNNSIASAALNLEGLELIIHWFTKTIYTVIPPDNPRALEVSQTFLLGQAMQHHFLLHGLLALSALHLAYSYSKTNPTTQEKYIRTATAHHNQGLAMFYRVLGDINESNYSATIAFSSLTTFFAFGRSIPQQGVEQSVKMELIDDLAQVFLLLKGWSKVVRVVQELGCATGVKVGQIHDPKLDAPLEPHMERTFIRLHKLNTTRSERKVMEIYTTAIDSLKALFRMLYSGITFHTHITLDWVNRVPEEFVRLIAMHQPLAVVLVAYYCVVLKHAPQVWWLDGWYKRLLDATWQNAPPEYQDELMWAREMVESVGGTKT
ncbi:hypothetical protein ACMFMG_005879 [Clarireedia jacksonii]